MRTRAVTADPASQQAWDRKAARARVRRKRAAQRRRYAKEQASNAARTKRLKRALAKMEWMRPLSRVLDVPGVGEVTVTVRMTRKGRAEVKAMGVPMLATMGRALEVVLAPLTIAGHRLTTPATDAAGDARGTPTLRSWSRTPRSLTAPRRTR